MGPIPEAASPPSMRALVRVAAAVAIGLSAATCSDSSGPDIHVSRVEVNLASPTILVGTNAAAIVKAFDIGGDVIADEDVDASWRSSAPAVVSVDKAGILTAKAIGSAVISATVRGVTGTASITVVPLPVTSVDITPNGGTLDRGQTLQLHSIVKNQFGEILNDRQVNWTSSIPGIAQVTTSGLVSAIAAGTTVITATSEEKSASVTITVQVTPSPGGPSITGITPSVLTPGGTATITGTNFGPAPASNDVRVAGVPATVLTATPTELTVQLGATGYACEPTRPVFVQVVYLTAADARSHLLQAAPQRTLQIGESAVLSGAAEARCVELTATGGRYIVSVYNASNAVSADTAFRLRGARGDIPSGLAAELTPRYAISTPTGSARGAASPQSLSLIFERTQARLREEAHLRLMEANLAQLRDGSSLVTRSRAMRASARAGITAAQPVGSTVNMRIPDVGGFLTGSVDYCTKNFAVTGRIAYNGARAIIVEDITSTFSGQMDSLYQKIGQEFDNTIYDLDRVHFGDPLRMDDLLDNNGKLVMLFSPRINSFGGIAGFVVSCDFKSPQTNPSSNQAEVFYAIVPTDPGNDTTKSGTRAYWYRTIRSTIVHEVKHISAFANRIRDFGENYEENWLEEGSARIAEELWSRTAAYPGLAQRGNASYQNTVFCDVRPSNPSAPQCSGKPYAMARHFAEGLYDFMKDNELRSPLGSKAGFVDFSYYGSAWALARWAADQNATDELTFFSNLTRTNQKGVANLAARVGRPWEEILGEWSLALVLDDLAGFTPVNQRLTFPSWNLRSIYSGLNFDFSTQFVPAFPLVPRTQAFGDFMLGVEKIGGGSFVLFELIGPQPGRQLLQIQSPNGGDPASKLRIAIVRTQ